MEHITFARFPDRQLAMAGVLALRDSVTSTFEVVAHFGSTSDSEFEQVVQHSGEVAESDLRHALVVGCATGTASGALFGLTLAVVEIFPGTAWQGMGFGSLMGFLIGVLVMSILGRSLMDGRLRKLTKGLQSGEVVITVRSNDRVASARIQQSLVEHGARIAQKSQS